MKIQLAAITDVGKERSNNEDAYIICPDLLQQNWSLNYTPSYINLNKHGAILVVADGMGGANAGEVASSLVIKSIKETLSKDIIEPYLDSGDIDNLLELCIKNADEAINNHICKNPETIGMGTTIVLCWIIGDKAHVVWCGDSRCYVFNPDSGIRQLTKDHSLVQELIDKGEISEEEAFSHPDSNIITNGIGDFDSQPIPDIITYSLHPNDTFLLCSDGLCGYCTNKEIEAVLKKYYSDIANCRDELLKLALNAGGFDNICIALASLIDDKQTAPAPLSRRHNVFIKFKQLFMSLKGTV